MSTTETFSRQYRLLTLDPMYSSLHWWIGRLVAKERYAILSSWALACYVPNYRVFLGHKLLKSHLDDTKPRLLRQKIASLSSYYHRWIEKTEHRDLNCSEIDYMASFYLAVEAFIVERDINLVILHNDTRWHHAVVIAICQTHKIPYLVTELGYLRPRTTMIDPIGSNANSQVAQEFALERLSSSLSPSSSLRWHHDSWVSKGCFALFLLLHSVEKRFGEALKYRHSSFPLRRYWRRFWRYHRKPTRLPFADRPSVLLILQLETDSQVLMFSDIYGNQKLIDHFERQCVRHRCQLVIKPHPLETKQYQYREDTQVSHTPIGTLASQVGAVFTINSSAMFEVLTTQTPIYAFGDSIFSQAGLVTRCHWQDLGAILAPRRWQQRAKSSANFLTYLSKHYLLRGSGFAFDRHTLTKKLQQLLEEK